MSVRSAAGQLHRVDRVLTDIGFILSQHSHRIVIQVLTHELLGDLPGAKTVQIVGHVDRGTLANLEYFAQELLKLGVDDGSINGQYTRGNLGSKCLASANKAVAEGRGCEEP